MYKFLMFTLIIFSVTTFGKTKKLVNCTPNPQKPKYSKDIKSEVMITFDKKMGWSKPAYCVYECEDNYFLENGNCIKTKEITCLPNIDKPKKSHDIIKKTKIYYSAKSGWDSAEICRWECDQDHTLEDGKCINKKITKCVSNPEKPKNSHDMLSYVTQYYNTRAGWRPDKYCNWDCNSGFKLKGGSCISKKELKKMAKKRKMKENRERRLRLEMIQAKHNKIDHSQLQEWKMPIPNVMVPKTTPINVPVIRSFP